ncbi:MAG: hypothetical protein NC489_45555, partial [Ruminococcus flavefaciens]|nr:hypothetical protein [Ruminococcus flavefaciens]
MKYDNGSDYGYAILNNLFTIEEYQKKYIVIYKFNCSAKLEVAYFHEHNIPVAAIVDSRPIRQNDKYCGVEILAPEKVLSNLPENAIIILSSAYEEPLLKELEVYGDDVLDKVIKTNLVDYDKYPNTLPKRDSA